jgi:hypothetical protein
VIVGGPGYGKTALINQVISKNAAVMCPPVRINCHVSSIYEPYEVIGNLLEELMSHASLPPTGTSFKVRRNSSPKRRRKSLGQDVFRSISEDEESCSGGDSPSFRSGGGNEDPETLRKQANENLYQSLSCWIEYNMPDTLFEYISNENIWKGSASTQHMDCKDDDNGIPVPHLMPERVASCLRSRSSRRFSVGSVGGVGVAIANKTKVFTALEVVSLLRICFDTEEIPSSSLLSEFTSNGLEDMISSILSEVITQLLASTASKCLVIEDLHWCDKRSFDALMLTLTVMEPDSFFLGSMRQTESARRSVRKSFAQVLSSEGSVSINSIDDLHVDCQILELQPFTKSDVRNMIQNTIGSALITETPNILSDENISRILSRSNSVPCEVAEQIKEMEMSITRSKYGTLVDQRALSAHRDGNLLVYDELSKESQILMKIAAVCGMTFSVALLHHTLTQMGYTSLVPILDRSLTLLEEKLVFKRVHHNSEPQQTGDSPHSLVSVKSRLFRTETSKGFSSHGLSSGVSSSSRLIQSRPPQVDPKKRIYTFLNKSFRETIYSLMLSTQRMTAHAIIGDYLANDYQEQQVHDCQDAESLAFHYSKADDLLKEVYYTVEAAKLFQKEYKLSTAYQHFHQLVVLSSSFESIETILQHCISRDTHSSYYEVFVKTFFTDFPFRNISNSIKYLRREDFLRSVSSLCDFIPSSHLSNFIAEMSILKFK